MTSAWHSSESDALNDWATTLLEKFSPMSLFILEVFLLSMQSDSKIFLRNLKQNINRTTFVIAREMSREIHTPAGITYLLKTTHFNIKRINWHCPFFRVNMARAVLLCCTNEISQQNKSLTVAFLDDFLRLLDFKTF